MITKQEIGRTWRRFWETRDQKYRNRLVEAYLPLARHAAGRLKDKLPGSIDYLDLVSAGHIGLIKAVEGFNAAYGVKFETYCNTRVRGAILDELRATDWIPRIIRARANLLRRARAELAFELRAALGSRGREPTDRELARRMGVTLSRYYATLEETKVRRQVSIEGDLARELQAGGSPDCEGDCSAEDLLPDHRAADPLEEVERAEVREIALRGMRPHEHAVIEMHYFEGRNMKEIGSSLGISSSRVCQIHARVMRLLRERFLSRAYRDWYDWVCGTTTARACPPEEMSARKKRSA